MSGGNKNSYVLAQTLLVCKYAWPFVTTKHQRSKKSDFVFKFAVEVFLPLDLNPNITKVILLACECVLMVI